MHVNRVCLPENYSRGTFLGIWNEYRDLVFLSHEERKDAVIGYIIEKLDTGRSFFDKENAVLRGHIFSLAVLPNYRHRGIGSTLLALAINAATDKGTKETFLEVRKSNKAAIGLYRDFGMETVGEVPGYYADGETAKVMAAPLIQYNEMVKTIIEKIKNAGSYSVD